MHDTSRHLRRSLSLAAVAVMVTAMGTASATAATPPVPQRCSGYVALTFDDGPNAGNTATLLATLKAAGVRATLFNIGQNVEANPELARAEVAAGMWLGNHSWDHPYMTQLSTADQLAEIAKTQRIIRQTTGVVPRLFRPPYLDTNDALRAVEKRFGLTEINADVDSRDWDNTSTDQIVANAQQLQAGGVILMHDWPPNTIAAIPRIVADLHARGLCAGMISPRTGKAVAPCGLPVHPRQASDASWPADERSAGLPAARS